MIGPSFAGGFYDLAPMHEAYLHGGTAEIDRMQRAGIIDIPTQDAWHQIHDGTTQNNPDLISSGNTQLLHREQFDIIADDYEEMRNRSVTGEAMTWMLTTVGTPSIPALRPIPNFSQPTSS